MSGSQSSGSMHLALFVASVAISFFVRSNFAHADSPVPLSDPLESSKSCQAETSNGRRFIVLGIAGGSGSGKTTLARSIQSTLGHDNITYITHDSYYKDISHLSIEERAKQNFDHPHSLDSSLLVEHLKILKQNKSVRIPSYDYSTHARLPGTVDVFPKPIILVEGILIFAEPALLEQMDMKIFVDTEDDIRLIRRMSRDLKERGRSAESVINQYLSTVRPMHKQFVEPSRMHADLIVPDSMNEVALDLFTARLTKAIHDDIAAVEATWGDDLQQAQVSAEEKKIVI